VSAIDLFSASTRAWFESTFPAPTPAQEQGWEAIASGRHTLIHAPTGSGKTLAAFLWAIDWLAAAPHPPEAERCRVLYVSPLKALAYDIERNLRAPLTGIRLAGERIGAPPLRISTAMRTGDTPSSERQQMLRHPPDILITTPESLYLMLTSRAREILSPVRWVIVDEIHSVAGTKRGTHLSLSLERLLRIADREPQRIGLSATQRPLETISQFLGGGTTEGDDWRPRPVTIVDTPKERRLDIEIVVPVEDMTRPEETPAPEPAPGEDPVRRSIWPAMYPRLLELAKQHRSTIFFVNSRSLAERLASELNRLAGEDLVRSHHGSVSRQQRLEIEDMLKRGELRAVVATSTLELGIDMATVDLVVLVESPSSVARGLQRVGRAGHQVGAPSVAKVFPKHRGDLLETAVVVERMYRGEIEETMIPSNPLDVLSQQIVAASATETWKVDDLFDLVRGAYPYRDLTRGLFESVLDMLAGRYPSDAFAELRPRVIWDRVAGTVEGRRNARILAVTNPGTIPDRGLFTVSLPEGGRVGELDEEMVYESRPGDVFVLGSSTWRIKEITLDRVLVEPAPGATTGRMPFWHGDAPGRPLELGRAVGAFIREIGALDRAEAESRLRERYRLDPWAAANLAGFIAEEQEATGALPTDTTIVVERFRDEIGDWRLVVLTPFGARVHAPWALAARHRYREQHGADVDLIWTDDGMMFRFPDVDTPPDTAEILLGPDEVEATLLAEVGDSALYTSRFREAAGRALLLPKRRPGTRTPLWLQRRKAANLLEVAREFDSFPIVLETYREVLQDHFDLPALRSVLDDISQRRTRVIEADLPSPSPFASSLMFDFIASFMYEYDAPIAEKRATALTLDRSLLAELLGDPEFRDLLDAEVIDVVERELQGLTDDRKARSADHLHDLLRNLGPLRTHEVRARVAEPSALDETLATLVSQRRVVEITIAGEHRIAAVEDVARLRDALGVSPPQGVAESLLEPVVDPLGDVVGRYARTNGPFTEVEAAATIGLPRAAVAEVLHRLEQEGRVTSGAYRPGRDGQEWVDVGVLRILRRRSLAALRSDVEPVEPDALGRLLPAWQGVGSQTSRPDRVLEVARQLQGARIPASALERDVLSARMSYDPSLLDDLLASGEVVWLGRGALGLKDGRVSLYLRDQVPLLAWDDGVEPPGSAEHEAILQHLSTRGASFFRELYETVGGGDPQTVLDALWDLVWAGTVTNDTLAPLRAFLWGKARSRSRRPALVRGATPPSGTGRWYLAADLVPTEASPEARAMARAELLLDRHGIVTRDAVLGEGLPGGFSGLYPVLAEMENAGRVRRGYFVEGRGGAQFGLPGAIDRLRSAPSSGPVVLAATDPANPYGSVLPWPDHDSGRPARQAGAYVVMVEGTLGAFAGAGGRHVLTFEALAPDAIGAAVAALLTHYRKPVLETIDGIATAASPLEASVRAAGFVPGYRGYTLRRPGFAAPLDEERNRGRARPR
jgi:ATP-dependent Lhr-like helicase